MINLKLNDVVPQVNHFTEFACVKCHLIPINSQGPKAILHLLHFGLSWTRDYSYLIWYFIPSNTSSYCGSFFSLYAWVLLIIFWPSVCAQFYLYWKTLSFYADLKLFSLIFFNKMRVILVHHLNKKNFSYNWLWSHFNIEVIWEQHQHPASVLFYQHYHIN